MSMNNGCSQKNSFSENNDIINDNDSRLVYNCLIENIKHLEIEDNNFINSNNF